MERQNPPGRTCPACGSREYAFRSRKKIEANPEKGEPEQTETKYRCKLCGKEWKEKAPGVLRKGHQAIRHLRIDPSGGEPYAVPCHAHCR